MESSSHKYYWKHREEVKERLKEKYLLTKYKNKILKEGYEQDVIEYMEGKIGLEDIRKRGELLGH